MFALLILICAIVCNWQLQTIILLLNWMPNQDMKIVGKSSCDLWVQIAIHFPIFLSIRISWTWISFITKTIINMRFITFHEIFMRDDESRLVKPRNVLPLFYVDIRVLFIKPVFLLFYTLRSLSHTKFLFTERWMNPWKTFQQPSLHRSRWRVVLKNFVSWRITKLRELKWK